MKSRVQKNRDLYENIASSAEEKVESSRLSKYANQLNQIDDRFERMNIMNSDVHNPGHAKEASSDSFYPSEYDTFENEYLKDFLDEVKEYNVKKGYRSSQDTQANILSAFGKQPSQPQEEDSEGSIESLVSSIEQNRLAMEAINQKTVSKLEQDAMDRFALNHSLDETHELKSLFETEPTLELKELDIEHSVSTEVSKPEDSELNQTSEYESFIPMEPIDLFDDIVHETGFSADKQVQSMSITPEIEPQTEKEVINAPPVKIVEPDTEATLELGGKVSDIHQITMEETQSIQVKLEEQQKDLVTINKSMVHTNRVLNSVIAIVLLCFLLVVAFIVKMFFFS